MDNVYKPIPFWSWNDELDEKTLVDQIDWMNQNGIGGFFMHARGGLITPYLGDKWFKCVEACLKKAKELNMEAYAYDENGWPSGFAGGKLLENEYNRDMYVTYHIGKYDPSSKIAYDISGPILKVVNSGNHVLNIYLHTSTSTADICNEEVVKKFINLTHEQYKKHDIYNNLRGFFTDEPQYYRWNTPFTRVLPDYFLKTYHEYVFDRIGLLFIEKEGYEDYRYKYYKAMQSLMLNSFSKQIYDWCDKNGYKLTGHYIEEQGLGKQILCCGGIMPFYEYEHIPGVDHLGRDINDNLTGRQLASVMSQLGKRKGLAEIFACAGWDATPLELKAIAEYYMINGVTTICHHLLPYSEHGQRKRDYPEHYSKINPWVNKAFLDFNNHFSTISELLCKSKEIVDVAILNPVRSGYLVYKRELEWDADFGVKKITDSFLDVSNLLTHNGVMFHYIDETLLEKYGSVAEDSLVVGKCKYHYIIIPKDILTIDASTMILLKEYINNGGKIVLMGDKPPYLEGHRFNHDYLINNYSVDEIIKNKPYSSSFNKNVKISYRINDEGNKFIYALNLGEETDIDINIKGYNSFISNDEIIPTHIHFDKYESKILYFSKEKAERKKRLIPLYLKDTFRIENKVTNYLTLDYLRYSLDNITYSDKMHYFAVLNNLLNERHKGLVYLKYEFNIKEIPHIFETLIEDSHIKEVNVNGHVIEDHESILEKDLWKYDIASQLKEGHNEIIVTIDFYESEQVYYALFGENVQESIKNCLVYDTTIEAIYLRGDFGVFGDFNPGIDNSIIIGNNFYIDRQKNVISSLIADGFPFLRGDISLEQFLEVDDVNKCLVIPQRFQLIDLYVNDVFVKRMMFDYKVDLSKYLKVGKNLIRIVLTISNRNLLGPHHDKEEEVMFVAPATFERIGTWDKDGKSDLCLSRYSFVKTLL